jgi:hypothetical protein
MEYNTRALHHNLAGKKVISLCIGAIYPGISTEFKNRIYEMPKKASHHTANMYRHKYTSH